jgi:hypothetical protein
LIAAIVTLALAGVALTCPVHASEPAEARISYLTSSSIYLDAGSEAGLTKGMIVTVVRDGAAITTLEVTALSSRRASCTRKDPEVELSVGDRVTFAPVFRSLDEPPAGSSPPPAVRADAGRRGERKFRGRLGFRYLGFSDRTGVGEDYQQPGLDVRLDGRALLEQVDVSVDVRTRRTYRTLTDGEGRQDDRTRVYRLLGRWRPPGRGLAITAGRQISASLASVSIFDGVAAAYETGHWAAGIFGGTQPGLEDFGWSDRIREYGLWIGWKSLGRETKGSLTTGFVGSYDEGSLDREYFVVTGRLRRGTVFAHATQEIDLNRGWKADREPSLTPTSTFLGARWDVRRNVSLDAGFDTRRAIRLYRHRVTPETEFDDSYRQGIWAGVRVRPLAHTSLGASFRRSAGGGAGAANAATVTLRSGRPALHDVSATIRSTRYHNEQLDGWLHSLTAGASLGSRIHADLTFGLRDETDGGLSTGTNDLRWTALDLDARVSRSWYMLLSGERSEGDTEENQQGHASAVYRF